MCCTRSPDGPLPTSRRNFLDSSTHIEAIAWDVTGEYVIVYNEEALRELLVKTGTVQNGEIKHKPFYYQMKVGHAASKDHGTPLGRCRGVR